MSTAGPPTPSATEAAGDRREGSQEEGRRLDAMSRFFYTVRPCWERVL